MNRELVEFLATYLCISNLSDAAISLTASLQYSKVKQFYLSFIGSAADIIKVKMFPRSKMLTTRKESVDNDHFT